MKLAINLPETNQDVLAMHNLFMVTSCKFSKKYLKNQRFLYSAANQHSRIIADINIHNDMAVYLQYNRLDDIYDLKTIYFVRTTIEKSYVLDILSEYDMPILPRKMKVTKPTIAIPTDEIVQLFNNSVKYCHEKEKNFKVVHYLQEF